MKILFVMIQPFDPFTGGVQMSTFKLSKKFTEMGMETIVYTFQNFGHLKAEYTTLYHSPNDKLHYNNENTDHLYELISKERPDFIINQMPYEEEINRILTQAKENYGCILLACLRNTLFSVKLNILDYIDGQVPSPANKFLHNPLGKALFQKIHKVKHAKALKMILDVYDRFVMFGTPNKDEIEYFVGKYKQNKLAYIPNSIPSVLSEVPLKEKKILWLSRLSYKQKQAQMILPVWKKVYKHLPDWELDIVGHGDSFDDVKRTIEKENIPRISLHGKQIPDEFFQKSAIYFMTSSYEGFPNTVIEAQSFGSIPVVFNSYPIASWVVNDARDGILIKPFDIDKMGEEIVKLASDNNKLELMSKNALMNAEKFHIDRIGEMWNDLFKLLQKEKS